MEHPLIDFSNRVHLISFIFRSALKSECPVDIIEMIVWYSQWIVTWKPEWPSQLDEHKLYLSGKIRPGDSNDISSYHWRNAGGTITSLNALPTFEDNVDNKYGKYIEWTVDFHRMAHCSQWFGITETPNWNQRYAYGARLRYGVDSNGAYQMPDDEYWYKPQKLEQPMGYSWKTAKAMIETYTFKYDIDEQTLTVYDPNMKKMGDISKDYTWNWPDYKGKWHIRAECHSVRSKLTYKFKENN